MVESRRSDVIGNGATDSRSVAGETQRPLPEDARAHAAPGVGAAAATAGMPNPRTRRHDGVQDRFDGAEQPFTARDVQEEHRRRQFFMFTIFA